MNAGMLPLALLLSASLRAAEPALPQEPLPVEVLTRVMVKTPETVEPDLAERLFQLMWSQAKGVSYIHPKRRKDPGLEDELRAGARVWVSGQLSGGEEKARAAAGLYFLLGAGSQTPSWAGSEPTLRAALDGAHAAELLERLRPWTENSGALPGQFTKKNRGFWPTAFLSGAAEEAQRLLTRRAAPQDPALESLSESLHKDRREAPGELMRFNKIRELVPPPLPKILKKAGQGALAPASTAPAKP